MPLEINGVTLIVMAVDNCNFTCRYCSTTNDTLAEVSPDVVEKAVRGLQNLFGSVTVGLSGGEPTLHSRFEDLIGTIAGCDADFYLVTNGAGFERVLPALENHRDHLSHVMFSLESADRAHNDRIRGEGAFDAVMVGLEICHQHGIRMGIGCALNRGNIGQVDALLRLAEEKMVVDGVYCWPAFPTRTLVEDGLVLTEADRAYLVKKAQQRTGNSQVLFGDLFRFDAFYQECAPLRLHQFTLHSDNRFSLCCNLSIYRGETGDADDLGDARKSEIADLVERHVDRARDYQKFLIRDVSQNHPQGLRAYPCFHCQSYHGKLDWLADAVLHRDGKHAAMDRELVQIQ